MGIEEKLQAMGYQLQAASNPQGSYTNCVRTGNLLYVSGKGPTVGLDTPPRGKLGREFSVEQGQQFARLTGLDILAAVKLELGTLDRVTQVVKLQGFINATEEFDAHPSVLNGCSDLFAELFGPIGVHARSVFGAVSLRDQLPLIIDSVFEFREVDEPG